MSAAMNEIERLKGEISAWQHRAWMASQQGNNELVQLAFVHKHKKETRLAELLGTDPPDEPQIGQDLDEGPEGGPDLDPSGVPRRPLPAAGGTTIALPLPDPADEDT